MSNAPRVSRPHSSVDHSALSKDDLKFVAYLDGSAMYNNARGYLYSAEQAREWFLEDGHLDVAPRFCDLVADQDYAWRVLRRPEFIAEVISFIEGGDNPKLTDEQKAKATALMIRLSDAQSVDVVVYCKEDEQVDLVMELAEPLYHYLHKGEIPELEEDDE